MEETEREARLSRQLKRAFEDKKVREHLRKGNVDYGTLKETLRRHIAEEDKRESRLLGFSRSIDKFNKYLVPVDTALDATSIFAGVGTGLKAIETALLKLPLYSVYSVI